MVVCRLVTVFTLQSYVDIADSSRVCFYGLCGLLQTSVKTLFVQVRFDFKSCCKPLDLHQAEIRRLEKCHPVVTLSVVCI